MAKRKKASKSVLSVLGSIWRTFAKGLGNTIRFTTRAAKDLDSAHQRDGAALLLVIIGLASVAGTWMNSDRKSTRLNSSHSQQSRMPSSA